MTHPSHPVLGEALCPVPLGPRPTTGTLSPWALRPLGDPVVVGPVHVEGLRSSLAPAHCRVCPAGRSRRRSAHPRETGIRVSASFPTAVGHTHWDWSSSNPALPLRGLT